MAGGPEVAKVREALRDYVALATAVTDDLLKTGRRNRESITLLVRHEVEQAVRRLGLASKTDVDELSRRVRDLERTLRDLTAKRP